MDIKKYDVVIIGGGTGGVCSAAALCNSGYKVALIESKNNFTDWMGWWMCNQIVS